VVVSNDHPPRPHRQLTIRHARGRFTERLRRGDTYGLLLAIILVGYVVIALLERSLWERFAISAIMGVTFLLALHTSHVRERGFRIGVVLVLFATLSTLVQALVGREGNDGSTFVVFLLVLVAPIVILNRILRHETIGTETILGAVCVYVLLGIAFSGIFAAIDDFDHGTFFAQPGIASNVEFLYFSFITMTTVGYGDLSPATDVGRVMVTFEALLGQVFLVTLVARLVSMYGMNRTSLGAELPPMARESGDSDGEEELE
jgi:voltage-gated potassium channel